MNHNYNGVFPGRRFETLEPEMNNLGMRVSDVNQVNQQLLGSENRDKDQIHQTQDQLNNRSALPLDFYCPE